MPTTYLTIPQLAEIIGADALAIAAPPVDPDAAAEWDAERIEDAIDSVGEHLDGALRDRYAIPLSRVSGFVRRLAARLVHAELVDDSTTTDLIQQRATEARANLTKIANGQIRLDAVGHADSTRAAEKPRPTSVIIGAVNDARRKFGGW